MGQSGAVLSRDDAFLSEILPPEERAVEAVVARYQRVAAAVTRFARSLADNEGLRVRLGSRTSAEPGEIVMDPGVFQAAYARRAPVTPAEVALASALHEAIHLVTTDFDEMRPVPPEWLPDDGEPPPETPVALLEALDHAGGPAAEAMFLAIEDARQEIQHLTAYPGARSVLADLYRASVPSAMEAARPMGQFALACFLAVGDYQTVKDLQRRSEPVVAAALEDARRLLRDAAEADGPWEAAGVALNLLAIARAHGLVTEASPSESPQARDNREEAEKRQIEESVDAVRLVTPILRDAESYDSARQAAQMSGDQAKRGDTTEAGDPATDQILRVSEGADVYLPTGQSGKLIISPVPDRFASLADNGREALEEAALRWGVAQRHISGELYPLFIANQRRGLRSGYDAGDLSPHAALLLGGGLYQRMFERRSLPSRRAYAVSLLVDGSASMLQPRPLPSGAKAPWAMAAATLGAWSLARLCDELQVEFEVALFNRAFAARVDDTERTYNERLNGTRGALRRSQGGAADRLTRTVNHYVVKSFDERWTATEATLAGLFWTAAKPAEAGMAARRSPADFPPVSMFEKAANVDELNVSHAAERLAARHAQVRILIVLADGMTRGSVETLAASVGAVEQTGTMVLGVGIGDATVEAAYGRSEVVSRPESLTRAMVEGVRGALRRSIAEQGGDTWWGHQASERYR
jgi:hypothetical protein